MRDIIDRQTFVISANLQTLNTVTTIPSIINVPMNLRFAADELVLKSISYSPLDGTNDVTNIIQIWCNITNDNLIASFGNDLSQSYQHNEHFRLNNTFQTGNLILQFLGTDGSIDNVPNFQSIASYNPQRLISTQLPQRTFGVVVLTIEFLKLSK